MPVNWLNYIFQLWKEDFLYLRHIRGVKSLGIATRRIFLENIFLSLRNCKVDIIFIKSFYLNRNTKFYEIILALLMNFFYTFEN